jgi:hypothetical protein
MQIIADLNNLFDQVKSVIEAEIPTNSQSLMENVNNLEKVAQYCEDIYVNSKENNKQAYLNETKSYTTQALASVAYQIHVLANNFIQLLDGQSIILNDMSESMQHLMHEVNIHKEKVARREIGILTTNKCCVKNPKVKRPDVDEKPVKYIRRPIDYAMLDDIGHGVKLNTRQSNSDPLNKIAVGRQNSYSSTHSSSSNTNANTSHLSSKSEIQTPPLMLKANTVLNVSNGLGTVRSNASSASYYRAPVVPPSVPSEYLSRQELGIYSSKKEMTQQYAGQNDVYASYGGVPSVYKKNSLQNNNLNNSEYSDAFFNTKRTGAFNMQDMNYSLNGIYNTANNMSMTNENNMNFNYSMGYASGKDLGLIRTNLNNIDYAANGTIYRRPQIHASVYDPSRVNIQNPQIYTRPSGDNTNPNYFNQNHNINPNESMPTMAHLPPPPPAVYEDDSNGHIRFRDIDDEDEEDETIPNWVPIDRCLEKVVTIFDYEGSRDDELSFKENMFIYVIKKNDDHWYEGIMKTENGNIVQGLYPYNYARCVKKYTDDSRVTQC